MKEENLLLIVAILAVIAGFFAVASTQSQEAKKARESYIIDCMLDADIEALRDDNIEQTLAECVRDYEELTQ